MKSESESGRSPSQTQSENPKFGVAWPGFGRGLASPKILRLFMARMGAQPDHTIPSQATPNPGQATPYPSQAMPNPGHVTANSGQAMPKPGQATPKSRPSHAKLRPLTLTLTLTLTRTRTGSVGGWIVLDNVHLARRGMQNLCQTVNRGGVDSFGMESSLSRMTGCGQGPLHSDLPG